MKSMPPFIAQERPDSCAIACLRMLLAHQNRNGVARISRSLNQNLQDFHATDLPKAARDLS
jgi:hypothetical protein